MNALFAHWMAIVWIAAKIDPFDPVTLEFALVQFAAIEEILKINLFQSSKRKSINAYLIFGMLMLM